jgi:hypothetical protein
MTESASEKVQQATGNGSEVRKTALRAAAIAAASGATAIAARKAFSGGGDQQGGGSRSRSGESSSNGGGDSLMGGVLGSGLNAAKDSLLPFAEDAAHAAGEFLGANGPDFVRDTIVPAFIEGFQSAQQSGGD